MLKKYQYGMDPAHIVELTENQARAMNEAVFFPTGEAEQAEGYTDFSGTLRLPEDVTVEDLSSATEILNQYIRDHGGSIPCTQEYLNDHDILTLVE